MKDSVINTLMFADDIVLLSTSGDSLRRHLSSLESLCKELKMEVNTAKTKISVIGRNTNKEPFWWKRTTIERVEAYKYLGVWTTTDGSYGRVKQHLANQGKQSIQVNKKFHKFERVYRDCIKRTRDNTRIHCIPHDAPGT